MIIEKLRDKKFIEDIDIWENSLKIFIFKKRKTENNLASAYAKWNRRDGISLKIY